MNTQTQSATVNHELTERILANGSRQNYKGIPRQKAHQDRKIDKPTALALIILAVAPVAIACLYHFNLISNI